MICGAGASCTSEEQQWDQRLSFVTRDLGFRFRATEFRRVVEERFRERGLTGMAPTVVYLGPHDSFELVASWYHLLLAEYAPRLVFVEANPAVLPALRRRLRLLGALNVSHVVHAAACASPVPGDEVAFHIFARRLLRDFPLLRRMPFQGFKAWSNSFSLDREHVARNHLLHFKAHSQGLFALEEWRAMLSYIEEIRVPCLTPEAILSGLGLGLSELDVLVIDAEGYDAALLDRLLRSEDFRPAYVQFEWGMMSNLYDLEGTYIGDEFFSQIMEPLVNKLALRGYDVFQETENVQAFLST